MTVTIMLDIIISTLGLLVLVTGSVLTIRSAPQKFTLREQKELIDVLTSAKEEQRQLITDLQLKYQRTSEQLVAVQSKVDVLEKIPLKEIARDMKAITDTQHAIIGLLTGGGANGKSTSTTN